MRTFLRVYLNYDLGKGAGRNSATGPQQHRLTAAERLILRTEIAHILNGTLPAYTVLKKELGQFYFEEPNEEL